MAGVWAADVADAMAVALDTATVANAGCKGVWDTEVPGNAPRPYVRVQAVTASDIHTFGSRPYQTFQMQVEAVAPNNRREATAIMNAVDTVLEGGDLTITGGTHDVTVRRGQLPPIPPTVGTDKQRYWKVGAMYEIGVRV